jgi:hypothetical protein
MIPDFDDTGNLPQGVHKATIEEIEARFGRQSEVRRVQFESVGWMIELATAAGCSRIIVNGSFVTAKLEPNDVDCVVLTSADFPKSAKAAEELQSGLPFLGIQLVGEDDFDLFVNEIFSVDREENRKGMVEVIL